nr:hypothetical protein [Mycobacterium sp.]
MTSKASLATETRPATQAGTTGATGFAGKSEATAQAGSGTRGRTAAKSPLTGKPRAAPKAGFASEAGLAGKTHATAQTALTTQTGGTAKSGTHGSTASKSGLTAETETGPSTQSGLAGQTKAAAQTRATANAKAQTAADFSTETQTETGRDAQTGPAAYVETQPGTDLQTQAHLAAEATAETTNRYERTRARAEAGPEAGPEFTPAGGATGPAAGPPGPRAETAPTRPEAVPAGPETMSRPKTRPRPETTPTRSETMSRPKTAPAGPAGSEATLPGARFAAAPTRLPAVPETARAGETSAIGIVRTGAEADQSAAQTTHDGVADAEHSAGAIHDRRESVADQGGPVLRDRGNETRAIPVSAVTGAVTPVARAVPRVTLTIPAVAGVIPAITRGIAILVGHDLLQAADRVARTQVHTRRRARHRGRELVGCHVDQTVVEHRLLWTLNEGLCRRRVGEQTQDVFDQRVHWYIPSVESCEAQDRIDRRSDRHAMDRPARRNRGLIPPLANSGSGSFGGSG